MSKNTLIAVCVVAGLSFIAAMTFALNGPAATEPVTTAPAEGEPSVEELYLAQLESSQYLDGISDEDLVELGVQACDMLDVMEPSSNTDVALALFSEFDDPESLAAASAVVRGAADNLCTEWSGLFN